MTVEQGPPSKVRRAVARDVAGIAELFLELKRHHRKIQPENPRYQVDDVRWREIAQEALDDPNAELYVVDDGHHLVAFMKISFGQKPWGTSCEVNTLVVRDGFRGRRLGTRLMEVGEETARERGAKGMRVEVLTGNEEGRLFYERLGYTEFALRYGKTI